MFPLLKRRGAVLCLPPLFMLSVRSAFAEQPLPAREAPPLSSASPGDPAVQLPRVVERTAPIYPEGESGRGVVQVGLWVVVETDGRPGALSVAEGAGEPFDTEAQRVVRTWRFAPAMRAGQPVASRVGVLVEFVPPSEAPAPDSSEESASPGKLASAPEPHRHGDEVQEPPDAHLAVTVHGERALRTERRGAADLFIHREILHAAPHQDGVDMLATVPGLVAGRGEGQAVAHAYSLRGFHAEHGQDIAFSVGGLPINLPAHIHGQGYADLNLLMPEVIDELSVSEGNADPAQGDFAMAGSIDVGLGVDDEHRGLSSSSSYGSFNQFRQALTWAPKEGQRESFGAVQYSQTDGYGERRAARTGSAILQHRFGQGALQFRAIGLLHTAHGQSAGLVRSSDITAKSLCFTCTYDDPTARDQSMLAQRAMAGFFADYRGREHESGSLGVWAGVDQFRARSNLTGYTLGTKNAEGQQLSDASEQTNHTQSIGLTGRYRSEAFHLARQFHGTVEVGGDARLDGIQQFKDLLDAPLRDDTWQQKVDQDITQAQLGLWFDLDFQLHDRVHLRAGARAAFLTYAVTDETGHNDPASDLDEEPSGAEQDTADALFVGPRSSLDVRVSRVFKLLASYGHGYRSPQPRSLHSDERAEYSIVRSGDLGFRYGPSEQLVLSGAAYLAYVGQDLVFEPHVGGLVNVGASRRAGGLLHLRLHPFEEFESALSVNYVDARILRAAEDEHHHEEEEEHGHEAHGHGEPGDPVVGVAPLSMRLDLNWKKPLLKWGAHPLVLGVGSGFTYRSPKPLGEDTWGSPWLLLDASVNVSWGPVALQFAGYNLLQQTYATEEYLSVSTWDPTGATPPSEDHHLGAGAPLSFMGTLMLLL